MTSSVLLTIATFALLAVVAPAIALTIWTIVLDGDAPRRGRTHRTGLMAVVAKHGLLAREPTETLVAEGRDRAVRRRALVGTRLKEEGRRPPSARVRGRWRLGAE
jgi:hypothetical protein